ncbi:MAG: DUF2889 domain-containing protein [Blastocatellia bacterium]
MNNQGQGPRFSLPIPDGGYERVFTGEIDVLTHNELLVRGQLRDHRYSIHHTWRLRTPDYEVLEASAAHEAGAPDQFSPDICLRYPEIQGVRIGRGFSRHITAAIGDLPGQTEHLSLAIEMARIGQQIYQFPPGFNEQFTQTTVSDTEAARVAWEKDRAYMTDLAESCYTYRAETAELFATRQVKCGFDISITRPQPGDKRAFWRNKRLTVSRDAQDGFLCAGAMEDKIHDIRLEFTMAADGLISGATSRGARLPYQGICEDAQLRTPLLNGARINGEYVKQFAEYVGGRNGCTHLFDQAMDCLRLFRF